ncbi:copper resistance protein [Cupriavidus sp. CP313]
MHKSLRRLWIAGFLLAAFLTVQLAAAAYACMGSRYSLSPMADMAGMTESCPEMAANAQQDTSKHDGLCLEHCQLNAKSADHYSPQVPAFMPVLLRVVEPAPAPAVGNLTLVQGNAVARAPPPPLSILHCCYRT